MEVSGLHNIRKQWVIQKEKVCFSKSLYRDKHIKQLKFFVLMEKDQLKHH